MYRISAKFNEEGIKRQSDQGAIFLTYGGCRQSYSEAYDWITRHKDLLESWTIFRQDETKVASSEGQNEY